MTTNNWMDKQVSCFASIKSVDPVNRRLKTWLTSIYRTSTNAETDRRDIVMNYRETRDPELKKLLPAFCPGAVLKTRSSQLSNSEKIENITGLMQFDIDGKDNPQIADFEKLRDEIFESECVAFCSLSTSGNGVWGLVIVSDSSDYTGHFAQLQLDFRWVFGIALDPSKGSNPTDLRFYSFDPQAKLREKPKLYNRKLGNRKPICPKAKMAKMASIPSSTDTVPEMIKQVSLMDIDIAPDYDTYVKCGFALANEYGEAGRELFHLLCAPHSEYDHHKTDNQFNKCLNANNGSVTIGTLVYLLKNALPNE